MTTILIVEDDPINLKVFSKILSKRGGFDIIGTENVKEIIDVTTSGKVELILMDVSLSNSFYDDKPVDGIKITQLIKSAQISQNIPIILITAHAMQGDKEYFLELSGADGYITKPIVNQDEFVNEIKSFLLLN